MLIPRPRVPFCFPSMDFPGVTVVRVGPVAERLFCSVPHVIRLIEDGSLIALDIRGLNKARGDYRIICECYRYFLAIRTIAPLLDEPEGQGALERASEEICRYAGLNVWTDSAAVVSAAAGALVIKNKACCTVDEFAARIGLRDDHLVGLVDSGLLSGIDIRAEASFRRTLRIPIEAQTAVLRAMLCEASWRARLLRSLPDAATTDFRSAVSALN